MTILKDNNYFIIYGWMSTQLKLSGTQLLVYALIYNFNRTTKAVFYGSNSYIKEWFGIGSRNTIASATNALAEKKLIYKKQLVIYGKQHNLYWINPDTLPACAEKVVVQNIDANYTDITIKIYESNMNKFLDADKELELHLQKSTASPSESAKVEVNNQLPSGQYLTPKKSKTVHNNNSKTNKEKNIKNTSDTKLSISKSRYEIATNYDELFLSRKDK